MTQWCQPHWDSLKEALRLRGLDAFGAQSADEAHADAVAQAEGEQTQFDPLMGSFWRITNEVLRVAGLGSMGQCPLCIVRDGSKPEEAMDKDWIEGVTDSALQHAIEQGLIKSQ